MAYIRGANYIWHGEDRVHFWAADGLDNWQESGWIEDVQSKATKGGDEVGPSGVGVDQAVGISMWSCASPNWYSNAVCARSLNVPSASTAGKAGAWLSRRSHRAWCTRSNTCRLATNRGEYSVSEQDSAVRTVPLLHSLDRCRCGHMWLY
jgi:hypothetical protein